VALRPNLAFSGSAESALDHYRSALGGDVEITRFAGTPAEPYAPGNNTSKVLYATLRSPFGDVNVMDVPDGRAADPGTNFSIAVDVDDETRAAEIFDALVTGGQVMMPFESTFFAQKFGMLADKFGVRWMITVSAAHPAADYA
jgi:PhnB protein